MQWLFLAAAVLASFLFAVSVTIDNEVREDVVPYMPTLVVVNGLVGVALLPVGFGVLVALASAGVVRPVALPTSPVVLGGLVLAGVVYAMALGTYFHVITIGEGDGGATEGDVEAGVNDGETAEGEDQAGGSRERVDVTLVVPLWEFVPFFVLLFQFGAGAFLVPPLDPAAVSPQLAVAHLVGIAALVTGGVALSVQKDYAKETGGDVAFRSWVSEKLEGTDGGDLTRHPLVLMLLASSFYAVFSVVLDLLVPNLNLLVAYLLTRPGVAAAGLAFAGYSAATPGESRVLRDFGSAWRRRGERDGAFVWFNEVVSFVAVFSMTVAFAYGEPSLATALTALQPFFLVLIALVVLPRVEAATSLDFKQIEGDRETVTRPMVGAMAVVLVGSYLVNCGSFLPGACG